MIGGEYEMLFSYTAKFRLNVSDIDNDCFLSTVQAYTKACGYVSHYIYETHNLKQLSLHKELYFSLRDLFFLRSQQAQSVIRTVIARYRASLSSKQPWTEIKFKQGEYDLVWNKDYSLRDVVFSVNTLTGRRKVGFYDNDYISQFFDGTWIFGTAKLICRHKKWYLHVPISKEIDTLQDCDVCNVTGIDLGVNFLATAYNSEGKTVFYSGKAVKAKRAHYKNLRRELQQVKTASSRRKLKAIGQRENRWMNDINHCITKALVESNPIGTMFVLEDLTGVRNVTERVCKKDRYVQVSWGFYDFRQKLEYKAKLHGQKVLIVSPKYTSQTCPKCGHVERQNRNKKTHTFCCKTCHYSSNDDRIGAMNLYRKGIEYLSTVAAE